MTDQNNAIALELEAVFYSAFLQALEKLGIDALKATSLFGSNPAPAPVAVGGDVVEAIKDTLVSLVAAHSLLSRSPKTAAPSNKMFDQMLKDYEKSIERGRKAYAALQAQPTASTAPPDDVVERVAKAIAKANGDEFANAFKNKERWTAKRGMSGGRFRDVNEPFQTDYLDMARAALAAMQQAPVADDVAKMLERLDNEQSLCRNDGADDIAALLGEAQTLIKGLTQPQPDAAVAVDQWQPIETAPRGGAVWVLLYNDRYEHSPSSYLIARWHGPLKRWAGNPNSKGRFALWDEATHWMPLPTPPAAIRAGGQQS